MRILLISSARSFGGGERHLADLANALARRGHEVYVALAPNSPLRAELTALPPDGIITLRLRNAFDLRSALELARIVREKRMEIVHAHLARDYPLAALATRRAREARFIITRHVLFPLNRLHALALSHVARVIAVSRSVAWGLQAQNLFSSHKISVIRNGIDLKRFDMSARGFSREEYRESLRLPLKRRLIGTAGEISPLKGQEEFLRAAALIARRFNDVDFVIAGEDRSRTGVYRAALERVINESGLDGRVHLLGWLEEVAPLLSSLDLFVSASRTESFGLSIVEAMASGAPVIATATEGAREIIGSERLGLLV
ncbi:MAG TPA: glycosyltransferase family 4 protein, partial [Pyrinomonadaceae bacterium]|nr:glycosyltransferase family 4 protein [Pyrinomonadaceae bacterium]